jgi:aldehyde dehydrogenase (NAD+)
MAPDYVLVHHSKHKALLKALIDTTKKFYSETPRNSEDFGRMCTEVHAHRMVKVCSLYLEW